MNNIIKDTRLPTEELIQAIFSFVQDKGNHEAYQDQTGMLLH